MTTLSKITGTFGLTEPVEYPNNEHIIPLVLGNMVNDDPEVHTQLIAGDRQSGVTYALFQVLKSYLSCIDHPIKVGFIIPRVLSCKNEYFENDTNYKVTRSLIAHIPTGSTIKFVNGTYDSVSGRTYDLIFMDEVDFIQNRVTELMFTGMIADNVIIGSTPSYGYVTNKEYTPDGNSPKYFNCDRVYRIASCVREHDISAIQHELDYQDGTLARNHPGLYRRILQEYVDDRS